MPGRKELRELWGHRPKPWIKRYLRSLKPRERKAAESQLLWADSMFTEARTSGNPLWIWKGYRHFRDHKLPVPEWLLNYFDAVAARLEAGVQAQPDAAYPVIANALYMHWRGRGNVFSTLRQYEEVVAATEMIQSRLRGERRAVGVGRAAKALGVDKRSARRYRREILRKAREPHAG